MNPRAILFSKVVSLAGDAIFNIGIPLFLVDKTGRADLFGYSLGFQTLTFMIVTLFGGFIADQVRTLKSCVMIDFLRFIIVLFLLWICQNAFSISSVVPLLMLLSGLTALYNIILDGMTMRIASHDELGWLLSRSTLCTQIFDAGGYALGGIIIAALGFKWAFVLNAASFFAAGLLLVRYFNSRYLAPKKSSSQNKTQRFYFLAGIKYFINHIKMGFKISWNDSTVRSIIALALGLNFLAATREVLWFPLLRQTHHLSAMQIGMCSSIVASFIALGSFAVQKLARTKNRWIPLTLIAQILVLAAGVTMGVNTSIIALIFGSMILGIAGLLHSLPSAMLRKEKVPAELQGSALAVARIFSRLVAPAAMFTVSWLQAKVDPSRIFIAVTFLTAVFSAAPFIQLLSTTKPTFRTPG